MRLMLGENRLGVTPGVDEADPIPLENRIAITKGHWLDRLYRTHRDKLTRFAGRHTGIEQAADVVQQLFTRLAARGPGSPLLADAPDAYLRQATINLIRDEARHAARRAAKLHVCSDHVILAGGDPVAALEARDVIARLETIVSCLPPRTREIFLAHRIDGFSYAEIAGRTGLSVKTVEKHMSRAIAYVTRHLAV